MNIVDLKSWKADMDSVRVSYAVTDIPYTLTYDAALQFIKTNTPATIMYGDTLTRKSIDIACEGTHLTVDIGYTK